MSLLLKVLGVLLGTAASAVLFNVPRAALAWCSLAGLLAWAVQVQVGFLGMPPEAGALLGALTISLVGEALARARRMPALVFVVPGILPLVPGTRAYHAMLAVLQDNHSLAAQEGIQALISAGGIAVGLLMGTALTRAGGRASSLEPTPRKARRPAGGRGAHGEPGPRRAVVLPLWGRGPGRQR